MRGARRRCLVSASMSPAMAPAVLPAPPFPWRPETGAPPSGTVGERGDRHSRLTSGGRNQRPAVRRGDPAPQAWGRKRRRAAPCDPPPATTLPPHLRKSLLGQIWGLCEPICPLPPRPPLPDRARPSYRAHSRHSALWAVAPGSVAQARPHSCAALCVPHGVKALEKEDRCAAKLHGLCLPSPRSASRRVLSCGAIAAPVSPPDNSPFLDPGGTRGSGPSVRRLPTG
jgi:hypothetical protein